MSVKNLIKSAMMLCLFVVSIPTFAQQAQRTPEERAQRQMTWMQKNLTLTEDQDKKVYGILLHYANEADKTMNTPAGPEKKAEKMDIQKAKDADLKGVLTGDQYQKYQAHVQEMKAKMQQRGGGMPEGGN
jgi:protein CpxP